MTGTTTTPSLKIRYEPAALHGELIRLCDSLSARLSTEQARASVGERWLARVSADQRLVRDQLLAPFHLVVMGDFKRGKSTLINALLGEEVVTSDVTPETVTINEISFAEEPCAQLRFADGGALPIERTRLKAEHLEAVLASLAAPPTNLSVSSSAPWLRRVVLVDTPGMGDMGWKFDRLVQSYLPRADAVLYVISAVSPLSESERLFLRSFFARNDLPRLVFVVNMLDTTTSAAEAERLLDSIRGRLSDLFPNAPVFGVSARDELARQCSTADASTRAAPDRQVELEGRFAELRRHLQDSILVNRDLIHLVRAVQQFDGVLTRFDEGLGRLQEAVNAEAEKLDVAIQQCSEQDNNLRQSIEVRRETARTSIRTLGKEAQTWMNELIDRLLKEVVPSLAQHPNDQVQKNFPYFLTDVLRWAIGACLHAHHQAIAAHLPSNDHAAPDLECSVPAVDAAIASAVGPGDSAMDTSTVNLSAVSMVLPAAGLALGFVVPVAGAAATLAGALAGALVPVSHLIGRLTGEPGKVRSYQTQLQQAFPELRAKVLAGTASIYEILATTVADEIGKSAQEEMARSVLAVEQAREIKRLGANNTLAATEDIQRLREAAMEHKSVLAELSRKLGDSFAVA